MSFPGMAFSVWRENRKTIESQGGLYFSRIPVFPGPGILDCSCDIRAEDEIRSSFAVCGSGTAFAREFLFALSRAPTKSIRTIISGMGVPEPVGPPSSRRWPEFLLICTGAHLTAAGRTRSDRPACGMPTESFCFLGFFRCDGDPGRRRT